MKKYNKNKSAFPVISTNMSQEMRLREYFLNISLKELKEEVTDEDIKETIVNRKFYCVHGKHCMYCASKDICLEFGANTGGE